MMHIEVNIGKACNHKCIFCMSGITRNKVLGFEKLETLKNEILDLSKKGYKSIGFLGGEPTIHPDFLELLNISKKNGFENIEVISNGSKFDDEIFLEKCINAGLTRISISIHSIDKKEESLLTGGVDNALEKKIKSIVNILNFYKKGYLKNELSVNIVVSKINYKNINKLILFLHKNGVNSFRLNFIQLEGYSIKYYDILALRYEEFTSYLGKIILLSKKYKNLRINFEAIPWCFSGLTYDEFLIYCEQNIDNIKDKISTDDIDFKSREIMNQLGRRLELKSYINKCDNCFLKGKCEGIWDRYLNYFKLK